MGRQPGEGGRPFLARRIATEEGLRERLEAAERLGVSPKRLDGWEPRETTVHEYDDDTGRLIRSTTTREPEWDDQQRGWMLALAHYRASHCPDCHGELRHTLTVEDWDVDPPIRCHRCTAIAEAATRHAKDHKHLHALRWTASPRRR
jgi:hypothetical protein